MTPDEVVVALRAAGCVFAEEEAALLLAEPSDDGELAARLTRRVAGEPLEHVLGWAGFCGLRVQVDPGVFVPRPRSAFLVQRAVDGLTPGAVVVDLCCGSGALGLAVAASVPGIELHAADNDPAAVTCATRNLAGLGRVVLGDLFAPLPAALRGRVELLLVNAPYVPSEAIVFMPSEARDHEPANALDGGGDGLDVHRRVAAAAPAWLAPGGRILIETSADQASVAAAVFDAVGLSARVEEDDELGATVVSGTRSTLTSG